jgi:hypothetical protein
MRLSLLLLATSVLGCGKPAGGGPCGFTSIAGATLLLQEFGVPNQTLSVAPSSVPGALVARLAAGPALPAVVGRTQDSSLLVGLEGSLPATARAGFGVLILDKTGKTRGIVVYESSPIRGAPEIGRLTVDSLVVPLLGIQLDPSRFEDPNCPFFPDSVLHQ